jgi:hypothetical protein
MSATTEVITKVTANDIICGRKGVALKHPGNLAYRKIVGSNKEAYATCLKNEKLRISKSIVAAMREVGGRFIERIDGKVSSSLEERDDDGNLVAYRDIGDRRAVEKTSQALREGQPMLLRKLAEKRGSKALASTRTTPTTQDLPAQALPPLPLETLPEEAATVRTMIHPTMPPATTSTDTTSYEYSDSLLRALVNSPYGAQLESSGAVTPPQVSIFPSYLQSLDADLLLIALLRRANGR